MPDTDEAKADTYTDKADKVIVGSDWTKLYQILIKILHIHATDNYKQEKTPGYPIFHTVYNYIRPLCPFQP